VTHPDYDKKSRGTTPAIGISGLPKLRNVPEAEGAKQEGGRSVFGTVESRGKQRPGDTLHREERNGLEKFQPAAEVGEGKGESPQFGEKFEKAW